MTKGISANKPTHGPGRGSKYRPSEAGFSKAERLSSKILIASLFEAGQSFLEAPYRVYLLKSALPAQTPVQLLISVPKKNFPRAHDRNRIKRLVREAYRQNKKELYAALTEKQQQLALGIVYTSKKITTFNDVENKIKVVLSRLIEDYDAA